MHSSPLPSSPRGILLVRDCLEAEAGFLLVQLIKAALAVNGGGGSGLAAGLPAVPPAPPAPDSAPNCRVVLLAVAQAASHYAAVLRKAGLSLPALAGAARLAIVELLPGLASPSGQPPSLRAVHAQLAAAVAAGDSNGASSGGSSHVSQGGSSGSGSGSGGICLVVDDLTALHCLADSPADWAAFLHACVALGQSPHCAFVGLAHSGVPDDEGWLALLEHAATVVLHVEPLESGRSADTTGRLAVTVRDAGPPALPTTAAAVPPAGAAAAVPPGTRHFCYKLGEMGASFVEQVVPEL